jgi:UDP-glucose 6-dehydrogenase
MKWWLRDSRAEKLINSIIYTEAVSKIFDLQMTKQKCEKINWKEYEVLEGKE